MINSWKIEVVSDGEDRQSSLKGSKNSSKRKLESNSYEFISLFRIEHNSKINVVHQLELIDSSGVASDVKSVMKKIESLTVDGTDSATKVDDIVCQSDITISRSSRKIAVGDVSNDISVYSSKFN